MTNDEYLTLIDEASVYDVARETPLELAGNLSARLGNRIFMKREDLQPVFSFKIRGAYNKIASLSQEALDAGVICSSAGNHAQGVALAAKRRDVRAVIVMPVTTPSIKIDAVRSLGGEVILQETYYSIGGGFVLTEAELAAGVGTDTGPASPYPFKNAVQMLEMCSAGGLSIAALKRANELVHMDQDALNAGLARLWEVMNACIERGLHTSGTLPGGLKVRRRAAAIHDALEGERGKNLTAPHTINDWMSVYAMAVNEENAAGGQVVTAPTNGAAGVIPATIRYWQDHVPGAAPDQIGDFLLTAAAIGGLVKHNASISGAECGCQAEVGSAAAMAAAGMACVLGGSPEQIENAAEIAPEHPLGMTCDPVGGLVQIPCIERNAMGAVKAINAARMALAGDGSHFVSLDKVIKTMRDTGRDMMAKYKETSRGGLAVNVVEC